MAPTPPVVYEDDHLIAFDKPAGLLIAPDRWDATLPNLVDIVRATYGPATANAHRLDKETSGVVLFAKTPEVLRETVRMFEDRTLEKRYWALVSPPPRVAEGEITHAIAPDERKPGKMRILPAGKPAQTHYRVAESWRGRWAAVELQPTTGRTHQLRIHLATIGCPILGDALYGGATAPSLSDFKRKSRNAREKAGRNDSAPILDRVALHAASLCFDHPVTGARVEIVVPLSKELDRALDLLRFYG